MTYSQSIFSNKRCREDRVVFNPPLKMITSLCFNNIMTLPIYHDNKFYVSLLDGSLKCLDYSGDVLWDKRITNGYNKNFLDGAMILKDDNIYIDSEESITVISISKEEILSKDKIPNIDLEQAIVTGTLLIGLFYENTDTFYFAAYDLETKVFIWKHPRITGVLSLKIAYDNNKVIISDILDELCCLDASTGKELWRRNLKEVVLSSGSENASGEYVPTGVAMISGNRLIQPIREHHIAMFDMETGETIWVKRIESKFTDTATIYPDDRIYLMSNKQLFIMDLKTGDTVKEHFFNKELILAGLGMPTDLAVSDNTIYVADSFKGNVGGLDKESMKITWSFKTKSAVPSSPGPTIIGDTLFVLDNEGNLYAFREER